TGIATNGAELAHTLRQLVHFALGHELPDLCVAVHRNVLSDDRDQHVDGFVNAHRAVRFGPLVENLDDGVVQAAAVCVLRHGQCAFVKCGGYRVTRYGCSSTRNTTNGELIRGKPNSRVTRGHLEITGAAGARTCPVRSGRTD